MNQINGQKLANLDEQTEFEQILPRIMSAINSSIQDEHKQNDPIISNSNDKDLDMTEKLQQLNQDLLERVTQLEQVLEESQAALQSSQQRSQLQDNLLNKQNQELNIASEQVTRLFREIESSHKVSQRQQILIETLSEQLENSQERIAELEKECASIQQRYNDQSYQLLQTENTCRELRDRLLRQQRHTLQFKTALEKCLEVPTINYDLNSEELNSATIITENEQLKNLFNPQSLIPKPPPIQPWTAPSDTELTSNSLNAISLSLSNSESSILEKYSLPKPEENLSENNVFEEEEKNYQKVENLDNNLETLELLDSESNSLNTDIINDESEQEFSGEINTGIEEEQLLNQEWADLSLEPVTTVKDDEISESKLTQIEDIMPQVTEETETFTASLADKHPAKAKKFRLQFNPINPPSNLQNQDAVNNTFVEYNYLTSSSSTLNHPIPKKKRPPAEKPIQLPKLPPTNQDF